MNLACAEQYSECLLKWAFPWIFLKVNVYNHWLMKSVWIGHMYVKAENKSELSKGRNTHWKLCIHANTLKQGKQIKTSCIPNWSMAKLAFNQFNF